MAEFQTQTTKSKVEEDQQEAPLYGDILESILSHVPLLYLVPACHVSKSWRHAASSSLRHFHRNIKPWLIVLTQTTRYPYVTSARAYDPASQVWIDIHPQPSDIPSIPILRSSHSTLLYMLSPSKFAFSTDPLHHTWHHAAAPLVWRTDPIVALVGHRIIVAGGTCDYEDDPLAVEMYDVTTRTWDTCDSMPAILKDSAASTWLSVAVDDSKMYVTEKISGVTYSFDPNSKAWFGPYDLRPDGSVFSSVIGFANGRLILVGAVGNAENLKGVKVWEVKGALLGRKEMIGEMPAEMVVEMVKGESGCVTSIGMSCMGNSVCLHNPAEPAEIIICELEGGGCRWVSVHNDVVNDRSRMQRLVVTCSNVGLPDLHKAVKVGAPRIV
ncbi:hypothetical protein PRUPE_1G249900 [Prunus persica]|uniref:Uncharacterized protein n=1 Tax=Prunus persica TaxID=3760 RepID=M5XFR0_PRUPE|nr:F-box/kelch-repeat protein At1g23390 [Prunus persica]ONI30416.1 hypothetical protein PRUPE_1G249900 [Prunus persica]